MQKTTKFKIGRGIVALFFAVSLLTVYLLDPTFAWFTDDENFENRDEIAAIEMDLQDASNQTLTSIANVTYTEAGSQATVIKVANTNSTINAIARVSVIAYWSNGLPIYQNAQATVDFDFNASAWVGFPDENSYIGFDYLYYNNTLAPNTSVIFLENIIFPTLPAAYLNQTLTISVVVEGLQANNAGVNYWKTQVPVEERAPAGWNPLGV
jgi:hypothetical protein